MGGSLDTLCHATYSCGQIAAVEAANLQPGALQLKQNYMVHQQLVNHRSQLHSVSPTQEMAAHSAC